MATAAMGERLRRLLDSPDLADALERAGRQRMVEGFSYSKMIGRIGAFYEQALQVTSLRVAPSAQEPHV